MGMDYTRWKGRRVFITGYTGFKGTWLLLLLHRLGANISGLSLSPPTDPNLFSLAFPEADERLKIGDVRDLALLKQMFAEESPELVIHLASQAIVLSSYSDPLETLSTNVMGTATLLEAARYFSSIRGVLVATSDKCYEDRPSPSGFREEDALGGVDPYSVSKACMELVARAFHSSFLDRQRGYALATARAGNVIGGGDWAASRLVPDAVRAFSKGSSLEVRNPSFVRPWQHVLEALVGYLTLSDRLLSDGQEYTGAWNFGPEAESLKSVGYLVDRITEHWGVGAAWHTTAEDSKRETSYLAIDSNKARTKLSWQPKWDLSPALERSIRWYKAYYTDPALALQLCSRDIEDYLRESRPTA